MTCWTRWSELLFPETSAKVIDGSENETIDCADWVCIFLKSAVIVCAYLKCWLKSTKIIHLGRFIFDSSWGSALVPWIQSLWQKRTWCHAGYCRLLRRLLWCHQMRMMMNKYNNEYSEILLVWPPVGHQYHSIVVSVRQSLLTTGIVYISYLYMSVFKWVS